jgi:hypothetical protein
MKIVITGHTQGIGKYLFAELTNAGHLVFGVSRFSGYNLEEGIDDVLQLANVCDVFINNAAVGNCQLKLLESLHNKVPMMIVMGSIAGDYHELIQSEYSFNKRALATRCKELSLVPGNKLLHLNISMLEDAVSSDNLISFKEILDVINFWTANPKINKIDFEFKLTPYTLEKVKEKFNASQEAIDHVIANMCDINQSAYNS